jgi:choline-sulfatase
MNTRFALVATLMLALGSAAVAEPNRPNVLFIAIDDLNDWIGCLGGHPQALTPHMDRLARRGTLFTNAHCQTPLCNSSRTSLLTGLRPSTTGIYGLAPWFRNVENLRDLVTLPQHFSRHGYATLSTGKIWHNGLPPKQARPAESDIWGPDAHVGATPPAKLVPPTPGGNHPLMDWGTFAHRDQDKGDWQIASWAVEQIQSRGREGKPFFMGVGFFLPHVPCYATPKWFDLYPESTLAMPPIKDDDRADTPEFSWYLHWKLPEPRLSWLREHDQLRPLVHAYLASISFVDSQVGRVLDALEAEGLADSTIVVLWSDHGWHLGEKGITGKNSLWERSTRVPLIFAGPGIAAGQRCDEPAELLDLYPTLIDLCGLSPREGLEGHSLIPQLKDAAAPRDWPAITTHNPDNHTVRSKRWRYIRYADGSEELYDMRADPNEWNNLAGDTRLTQIKRDHARWLPAVSAPPAPGSAHRILVREGDQWLWEGRPIVASERLE